MRKQIGDMLVGGGVITPQQLEISLAKQRSSGTRLASQCLKLGFADESSLARMLSRQLGIPFVVLSRCAIPLDVLKEIPVHEAYRLRALAIARHKQSLIVAFADPNDTHQTDEVRFISGKRIIEHGALIGPLLDTIEKAYQHSQDSTQPFYLGPEIDPNKELPEAGVAEIACTEDPDSPTPTPLDPGLMPDVNIVIDDKSNLKTHQPAEQEDSRPDQQVSPTILVVDDDETLRTMLVKFLIKSGYQVWQAADGRQTLHLLQSSLPDAILLDAMLPGVHGFNICRLIKTADATRHIPVIMITAIYRSREYKDKVRLLYGANAYLEKPLKLSQLKQVLDNCLAVREHRSSQQEISTKAASIQNAVTQAVDQGDLTTATRNLEQLVTVLPFYASLHCKLAVLYDRLGEKYRSISHFEQAAQLEPSYSILFHLAKTYEKMGFFRKAIKTWEQCVLSCEISKDAELIRHHMEKLLE